MQIRFAKSARKHRVGRAHAEHVLANTFGEPVSASDGTPALLFVGPDDRGIDLEVIVVPILEVLLVIHVMPAHYRRH